MTLAELTPRFLGSQSRTKLICRTKDRSAGIAVEHKSSLDDVVTDKYYCSIADLKDDYDGI